ncbi:serine/threonine-protein kinase [Streptomyces sp. NPDC057499]|uniref:serine/threonine-protein kinase n=1 Tax=Streptomyces sp. NPDC057499 TaxID=3346150 RepID=UPI0036CAE6E8
MRDQLLGSRYRLVRQLGEGGMGEVWEAQDETLDRRVAVKVISLLAGGGSRGSEARARFLREARITAGLQHPNVVTVHDLGESGTENGDAPFLVMELLQGETLDAKLRRGPVPPAAAARWGAQVCDALTEAHAAGVLHRDIKPSNIVITGSGTVKVLDFGVARAADPYATSDRLTRTGVIVGTPPYMAPEQARGRPEPGSDLYALGCLLFELITGRLPFKAPDAMGFLTAHLSQDAPAPSSVVPGIPAPWDDLVLTLLRKDPAERYASAAEVALALRRLTHLSGSTPSSPTSSSFSAALPTLRFPAPRSVPPPARPRNPIPTGTWRAAGVWLLVVMVSTPLAVGNANGAGDARDISSAVGMITLATAVFISYVVLAVPGGAGVQLLDWRAKAAALFRFLPPTLLFGAYVTAASPNAEYHPYMTSAGSSLALAGLLVLAAVLTPRSGRGTRGVGYVFLGLNAAAVFNTEILVLMDVRFPYLALVPPLTVSLGVTVLAIALFRVRETATRRPAHQPDAA